MGVAAAPPGRSALQAMFSLRLHCDGRFFSSLEPLKNGPRQCGQSPARTAEAGTTETNISSVVVNNILRLSCAIKVFLLRTGVNGGRFIPGPRRGIKSSGINVR